MASSGDAEGDSAHRRAAVAARDVVERFYDAWLDRDFRSACELTARDFHLRPAQIAGVNVNTQSGGGVDAPRFEPAKEGGGRCAELLESAYEARGEAFPRSALTIDELRIASDARRAYATTPDGESGLVLESGRWKMLWIVGPPPRVT